MKFEIYKTDEFRKEYSKLDKSVSDKVDKEIEQLEDNPYSGRPLGYKFFREKKVEGFRIYYLIYGSYAVVFLITIGGKKDQKKTINTIKMLMPYYREEIRKRFGLS